MGDSCSAGRARLVDRWARVESGLVSALDWRTGLRREALDRKLATRCEAERGRVVEDLDRFERNLRAALAQDENDAEDALFSRVEAAKTRDELAQYRRDRQSWERRLSGLAAERERELAAIDARYRDPRPHQFPVAVVFVVPHHQATA